jgi:hypothetical protein
MVQYVYQAHWISGDARKLMYIFNVIPFAHVVALAFLLNRHQHESGPDHDQQFRQLATISVPAAVTTWSLELSRPAQTRL